MKKKKTKQKGPKRKRLKRAGRLDNAKVWIKNYEGKNIVKSYAKWYGVDIICAMTEIEMLGMTFSEKRKSQIKQELADSKRQKSLRKKKRKVKEAMMEYDYDSDETFAFIAGYTEGDIPFGITHEEMEELDRRENNWAPTLFKEEDFEYEFEEDEWDHEWHEPTDEEWAEYLLENQTTEIRWENDNWYSASFNWKDYFSDPAPFQDQEELVYELNKMDLQKEIRRKKRCS